MKTKTSPKNRDSVTDIDIGIADPVFLSHPITRFDFFGSWRAAAP